MGNRQRPTGTPKESSRSATSSVHSNPPGRGAGRGSAPKGIARHGVEADPVGIRITSTITHAKAAGLIGGEKTERIAGRVARELLQAAKARSGLQSDTQLIEYALSKVVLEDDFGKKLLARKGSVPADVEL